MIIKFYASGGIHCPELDREETLEEKWWRERQEHLSIRHYADGRGFYFKPCSGCKELEATRPR